jgi:hypothetical protein
MCNYDGAVRTRTLARIVGSYLTVMAITLAVRREALATLFPAFMQDAPLVLATGAFTLMAGLAILAAHHHWTSPSAVVLSLVGVAAALKGAALMIAPSFGASMTAAVARRPAVLLIVGAVMLAVGLWLSFVGWSAKGQSRRD